MEYDANEQYDSGVVVVNSGDYYVSRKLVPGKVDIEDTEFWTKINEYNLNNVVNNTNRFVNIQTRTGTSNDDGVITIAAAILTASSTVNGVVVKYLYRIDDRTYLQLTDVDGNILPNTYVSYQTCTYTSSLYTILG